MVYIISAIRKLDGERIDLFAQGAPTPEIACIRAVTKLDPEFRKKIQPASLEARPAKRIGGATVAIDAAIEKAKRS